MSCRLQNALLYGIIDLGYVKPEDISERTTQLLEGGVDILQLRAKNHAAEDIKIWAEQILPLCREANIPFIVNDFPDIAKEVGADGVHIGQEDGSLASVRKIVGEGMIVGRSTHNPEQAKAALMEGFDYIGFGPIFPTPTKKGRPAIGLQNIDEVQKSVGSEITMFCIGGIKPDNLGTVLNAGAKRVVIVSGILTADNPTSATESVKKQLTE